MKTTTLTFLLLMLQQTTASVFKANNFFPQMVADTSGVSDNKLLLANINNDGIDDLVFTSYLDQGLTIYIGQPGGGFKELFTTPVVSQVYDSEVFDVDGDGDSDIWLTLFSTEDEYDVILLNDGKGRFSKKVITNSENYNFRFTNEIHFGDIDNDGDLDLIKVINDREEGSFIDLGILAEVFINEGSANFIRQENKFDMDKFSHLADFNQDGYLDLIAGYYDLKVYYNNQAGSFYETAQSFELNMPFSACGGLSSLSEFLIFGDIDNDGDVDVQMTTKSQGLPRRINNGDGTFTASQDTGCTPFEADPNGPLPNTDSRPTPSGLLIDVNQDGLKDLWLGYDKQQKSTAILTGLNGQMTEQVFQVDEKEIFYLLSGDFNQDGFEDVVTLGYQGINQWLFDSPLNFTQTDLTKLNQQWGFVVSTAVEDFNGDGKVDLFQSQQNGVFYRSGNGAGTFDGLYKLLPFGLYGLQVLDFNQDGLIDLVGIQKMDEQFIFTLALQIETGGYQVKETPLGESLYGVIFDLSDFDSDGDIDFIANVNDDIHVYQNQAGEGFDLIQKTANKWYAGAQFIDLNQQNRAAFIAFNNIDFSEQTEQGIHEWVWNGATFELTRTAGFSRYQVSFVTNDFDGDGDLDILTSTTVDEGQKLLVVNETNAFSISQYAYPGVNGVDFAADLNLDGLTDFISSNGSIYFNHGENGFSEETENGDRGKIQQVIDLDGDGDLDLVATDIGLQTHLNQTTQFDLSGLWYNPEQQGHGLSLEQLVVGGEPSVLFSWFAFHQQKPFWLIGMAPINGNQAQIDVVSTSGTGFGSAFNSQDIIQSPWGVVDISLLDDELSVSWQPTESGFDSGQMQMQRLSVVKEPTAQRHVMNSCHSGSWFNSAQDGHGLFVQVINQNGQDALLVSWYHYAENEQYWMVGQGPIQGQQATTTLYSGEGGLFPPHFETADADLQPWGQLSFKLLSDSTALINWVSDKPGFEDGQLHLEKLTQLDRYHCAE